MTLEQSAVTFTNKSIIGHHPHCLAQKRLLQHWAAKIIIVQALGGAHEKVEVVLLTRNAHEVRRVAVHHGVAPALWTRNCPCQDRARVWHSPAPSQNALRLSTHHSQPDKAQPLHCKRQKLCCLTQEFISFYTHTAQRSYEIIFRSIV